MSQRLESLLDAQRLADCEANDTACAQSAPVAAHPVAAQAHTQPVPRGFAAACWSLTLACATFSAGFVTAHHAQHPELSRVPPIVMQPLEPASAPHRTLHVMA